MNDALRRWAVRTRLPLVLGLTDGLLTALTLSADSLTSSGAGVDLFLSVRVGCVALVTSAFTVFVADYAERRAELTRASEQLNLTRRGQLATTRLGRLARYRALTASLVASTSGFLAAALPLMVGALIPGPAWGVIVVVVAALMALGAVLARILAGSTGRWVLAMGLGGVAITWIGIQLHIA
ncbi:hypothetical protein HCC61_29370 [Streptomyces sp. HNM0575]|uniref:hypothetical protein n=1 Tax=Streptomyces sp. HNM0575 TaxID=2716338 RepID=UPI00145D0DF2|nr:hypothetical protein [Streptomyces sp. HNM0575]NLU76684.1 hypothetical protein [Streptomyces sp. HNM0575]